MFTLYDVAKDGSIDCAELKNVLQSLGEAASEARHASCRARHHCGLGSHTLGSEGARRALCDVNTISHSRTF